MAPAATISRCVALLLCVSLSTKCHAVSRMTQASSDHEPRYKRQIPLTNLNSRAVTYGLSSGALTEHGPWGPWTQSSQCSRPCGGGVAFQDRICMDVRLDGSHSCIGASRRYFSCNTQDCPVGTKDLRAEQCAAANTVSYGGIFYSWKPYIKVSSPCELNCKTRGERVYKTVSRKVIDGTRCYNDGSLDVCVDGVCVPVGCDRALGSAMQEDTCGVCGGDGSTCHVVKGLLDRNDFEIGYNDILLIPKGATAVFIEEVQPTNNYFAIRNLAGKFYLNGNWQIESPREIRFAGTVFHYKRKTSDPKSPEILQSKGPTTEPMFIVLLFQEKNLGLSYEYSVPYGVSTAKPDSYSWSFGDFEECSQTCGGGVQHRPVRCIRSSDRDTVSDDLCDPAIKPSMNQTCNNEPCPAKWQIGEWSNCSHACGGGSQFRLVFCHQVKNGKTTVLVSEEECNQPKPLFMRTCNEDKECPSWVAAEWSQCDKNCGAGNQTRKVECRTPDAEEAWDDSHCNADNKLATFQQCSLGPCEGVEWIVSDWSGCDGMCSSSMESREAHCTNEEGVLFPDEACDPTRIPKLTRSCPVSAVCEPMWHTSEWTECSAKCGMGVQTRVVFCGVWEDNAVIKIDDSKCAVEKKFSDVQNCSSTSCKGVWFSGPWNRCSSACGGGQRSRKILCFYEDEVVDSSRCDDADRPFDEESCNMRPCDEDEILMLGGCKDTKYGCCADGMTRAGGENFEGCPAMRVTPDGSCEESDFGCCADGITLASGPFRKGCPTTSLCNTTKYGCCSDQVTEAQGPGGEGCPGSVDCSNTTYGCCPDGNTAAEGEDLLGCDVTITSICPDCYNDTVESSGEEDCGSTEFGCCPDGMTPAHGPNNEECPPDVTVSALNCSDAKFGCCKDNFTVAEGPDGEGCDGEEGSGEMPDQKDCELSLFGCCPDNVTFAKGMDGEGCKEINCTASEYGCCPDNTTIALGPDGEGCVESNVTCDNSTFGCCPDNVTTAKGLNFEGCSDVVVDCNGTEFGCCEDNVTAASGPNSKGCNCSLSAFGCCPDNVTVALGDDGEGCPSEIIVDCQNSTFGCCSDNVTAAEGPDGEGCPQIIAINCENSTYGCCPDNMTVALGPDGEGCEVTNCKNSTYGCCPDNVTEAQGLNLEGCPSADCQNSTFGCCPDGITQALGPESEGCMEVLTTQLTTTLTTTALPEEDACSNTLFGCCPDGRTIAQGPNLQGCCFGLRFGCCPDNMTAALGPNFLGCGCQTYPYGCCPDGITPAQGHRYYGCRCEHFRYGCCQDQATPASGPHFEGCVCQEMRYGCCPDGETPMTGPDGEGCESCATSRYGCCPDGLTAAPNADLSGCPCDALRYGCCPDGRTPARSPDPNDCPCQYHKYGCCPDQQTPASGPQQEGCPCGLTRFGCCRDGKTPAESHEIQGCPCEIARYGCCADGVTHAQGPNLLGCPPVRQPQPKVSSDVCILPKELGPCHNYTVKWFFDVQYGGCSRFWYGGCDGNGNVFTTQEDCEAVCVKPEGKGACLLPRVTGPCEGKYPSWYYDIGSQNCEPFTYSGCLGNNNRFSSNEICLQTCMEHEEVDPVDVCSLPKEEGPCDGAVIHWYYNTGTVRCEQFYYGGCRGNANRFQTRSDCERKCFPTTERDSICTLPQDIGTCSNFRERWFFDYELGQCRNFYFSGCGGNENNFGTYTECEKHCSTDLTPEPTEQEFVIEFCALKPDAGPCTNKEIRWFYDKSDGVCREFTYGGCNGNRNKFHSKKECETSCGHSQDVCELPKAKGPCSGSFTQWYYDSYQDACHEFEYGGCQGNANRFNSRENCERQCKKVIPTTERSLSRDDVCSLPQEPGPCLGYYRMWYYDSKENMCKSFVYGGCDGNENRFEKRTECEQKCYKKRKVLPTKVIPTATTGSPEPSNEDVCRLPAEPGPCSERNARWFYDSQSQTCLRFEYGGCGGNKNRFKTVAICMRFCTGITASTSEHTEAASTTTTSTVPVTEPPCPRSNCADIQCPFGIEEVFDAVGCSVCRCSNPCEALSCPDDQRCAIQISRSSQGATRTEPVCREIHKSGECPSISVINQLYPPESSQRLCSDHCRDDADCRGGDKCCHNGCAFVCLEPNQLEETTVAPVPIVPVSAQLILVTEPVTAGSPLQLDCHVQGPSPGPEVTWHFQGTEIVSSDRREIFSNNTLFIANSEMQDSGEYSCTAQSGGSVASSAVSLSVKDPAMPADCVDSPRFAHCEMIVKTNYCNNKYYGKFCCQSCMRAGQLTKWPLE